MSAGASEKSAFITAHSPSLMMYTLSDTSPAVQRIPPRCTVSHSAEAQRARIWRGRSVRKTVVRWSTSMFLAIIPSYPYLRTARYANRGRTISTDCSSATMDARKPRCEGDRSACSPHAHPACSTCITRSPLKTYSGTASRHVSIISQNSSNSISPVPSSSTSAMSFSTCSIVITAPALVSASCISSLSMAPEPSTSISSNTSLLIFQRWMRCHQVRYPPGTPFSIIVTNWSNEIFSPSSRSPRTFIIGSTSSSDSNLSRSTSAALTLGTLSNPVPTSSTSSNQFLSSSTRTSAFAPVLAASASISASSSCFAIKLVLTLGILEVLFDLISSTSSSSGPLALLGRALVST
mmetsp:Transcript_16563/g.36021  ORF Transcript_16563/g.36021 Transcript_16563/m.36021 type:complete len:350 (+) Transcript_16563:1393-2442(+)